MKVEGELTNLLRKGGLRHCIIILGIVDQCFKRPPQMVFIEGLKNIHGSSLTQ